MPKMNRNIKLSDELYDWLLENARVRETFDQELKRLLSFANRKKMEETLQRLSK